MARVKDHYDAHLGKFYSWMLGNFEEKMRQQLDYFTQQQIKPLQNKVAIDLGCGNGIQSIALAELGFHVTAVDFNSSLLNELRENAGGKPITIIEASITDVQQYKQDAELMVCMGDTITHLESVEEIERMLNEWYNLLLPAGKLILSFRELAIPLSEEKRFIPVRSDADRILTCFLEYHEGYVMVHDLLHERINDQWQFWASAYKKIRLSRNQVAGLLVKAGFRVVDGQTIQGMLYLRAEK